MNRVRVDNNPTQKTIQQLKRSIDSIERMIEKSQQILVDTRPVEPREARSDSLGLKLNLRSKSKSRSKGKTDAITHKLNLTNTSTQDASHQKSYLDKIKKKPQKTKPHLFIDTEAINQGRKEESEGKMLIEDLTSPPSVIQYKNQQPSRESAFMDSFENPFKYGHRYKTQTVDDSWEQEYSLQGSRQKKKQESESTKHHKKVVLHRKRGAHFKNYSELENFASTRKRKIFDCPVQPGKYSYYQQKLTKGQIVKQVEKSSPRKREDFRLANLSSSRESCLRHQRQQEQMGLEQFIKKVKQYGFVERYLTRSQLCCIYQYLRRSSIPEHRWPLYVVDQVYQKMQTPKNKN